MEKPLATRSLMLAFTLGLALGLAQAPVAAASPTPAGAGGEPANGGSGSGKPTGKKKGTRSGKHRHGGGSGGGSSEGDARAAAERAAKDKPLTVFPAEQATVSRVFDERRRELVADAERAARAPKQDDRWHTVLFAIRELDSTTSYDVCFWRTVAYYRLGELARAHRTRKLCDIAPRDQGTLDLEEMTATNMQPPAVISELRMAGDVDTDAPPPPGAPQPVANPAAYTGPSPTPPTPKK